MNRKFCASGAILAAFLSAPVIGQEAPATPAMIELPAGAFAFGSPEDEDGHQVDETPLRDVRVPAFALGRYEVTVGEYRRFIADTGYTPPFGCLVTQTTGGWAYDPEGSWNNPGFEQDETHPVVCVSWNDAKAYVAWLNTQDGSARYRLPSETEWEYAARAGGSSAYAWGENEGDFCTFTNGADASARAVYQEWPRTGACDDGFVHTAPVGHFAKPNAFGVEDIIGNVWEWVEDCYTATHADNPGNGSAVQATNQPCEKRVMRGGAFGDYGSFYLRTAYRGAWDGSQSFSNIGFRVARSAKAAD